MGNYFEAVGRETDVWINVATGGQRDQTVSERIARAAAAGSRIACLGCAALSVLIQPNHCQAALNPNSGPSPWWVYVRAALAFGLVFALIAAAAHGILEVLR